MAITTRLGKGSALSHAELDTNFTDLDTRSSDNDIRLTALEDDTLDARLVVLETDISNYVSIATLKAEVAASTDFADFQARIAAL